MAQPFYIKRGATLPNLDYVLYQTVTVTDEDGVETVARSLVDIDLTGATVTFLFKFTGLDVISVSGAVVSNDTKTVRPALTTTTFNALTATKEGTYQVKIALSGGAGTAIWPLVTSEDAELQEGEPITVHYNFA